MPRYSPTPGWLAMQLSACGHELGLSLLGAGVLTTRYKADREAPVGSDACETLYGGLAASVNPLHDLRGVYEAVGQEYDYLLDAVAPLLGWAEYPTSHAETTVRNVAALLAEVDFMDAIKIAGGDLLGQVRVELEIMILRRRPPYDYLDLETAALAA